MTQTPATTAAAPSRDAATALPGIVLIAVGFVLLAVQLFGLNGDVVVLLIGLGFAVGYGATRSYGLLVPAGILSGLGAGIVLEDYYPAMAEPVVLGLGLGFLAIYVVDVLIAGATGIARWWPVIPGGILLTVAIANGAFGTEGARTIELWWPVLLIVFGAVLLLRRTIPTKSG